MRIVCAMDNLLDHSEVIFISSLNPNQKEGGEEALVLGHLVLAPGIWHHWLLVVSFGSMRDIMGWYFHHRSDYVKCTSWSPSVTELPQKLWDHKGFRIGYF